MLEKLIWSFSLNWVVDTHINMFQKNTKHIARQNQKNELIKSNFEKCGLEKIAFKVFSGYKDEKNSYLSTAYTNLAEIWR